MATRTTTDPLIPTSSPVTVTRTSRNKPSRRLQAARQWLRARLATEEVPAVQLKAEAFAAGHRLTTLELAAKLEGVEKTFGHNQEGPRLVRRSHWAAAGTKAALADRTAHLKPLAAAWNESLFDPHRRKRRRPRPEPLGETEARRASAEWSARVLAETAEIRAGNTPDRAKWLAEQEAWEAAQAAKGEELTKRADAVS